MDLKAIAVNRQKNAGYPIQGDGGKLIDGFFTDGIHILYAQPAIDFIADDINVALTYRLGQFTCGQEVTPFPLPP